jgi:hypothetical protein
MDVDTPTCFCVDLRRFGAWGRQREARPAMSQRAAVGFSASGGEAMCLLVQMQQLHGLMNC